MNLKDLQALALLAMTATFSCDQLAANDDLKNIEAESAIQSSGQHVIYRTMGCCQCDGRRGQRMIDPMATHKDL